MSQTTRRRVAEKIDSLEKDKGLPFTEILDAEMVEEALAAEGVVYNRSIYTPFVTLWTFLSQVLDPDHSCRAAVARVIVWLVIRDREACSEQTGTYCEARARLPLGVVVRLVRRTGYEIESGAAADWLWKGRRVLLVDGTTASMPDTPALQAHFGQPGNQAVGFGFPVAHLLALFHAGAGLLPEVAAAPLRSQDFAGLADVLGRLAAGDVPVADRGFCSFAGLATVMSRGIHAVFRLHQKQIVDFTRATPTPIRAGVAPPRGCRGAGGSGPMG